MDKYHAQIILLLKVLPEVAKEKCFALHGGTAINLFMRDMPRLSVDIDLTYLNLETRDESIKNINEALGRISQSILTNIINTRVEHVENQLKLYVSDHTALIKIEVNQAMRGVIAKVLEKSMAIRVQTEFGAFTAIQVVPIGQLYGGKICAALDRQHPRDLFDVKYLLQNEGFNDDIRRGFIFCLLASKRPLHEMLNPNLIDQSSALQDHFTGMSKENFEYPDYEITRKILIKTIHANLTETDKEFLISFENAAPDWNIYDFKRFPAVQWKLQNLIKLKRTNPRKHSMQLESLKKAVFHS